MDRIGDDHQSANGLFNVQRVHGSVDGGANILSTKGDTNLAHRKKNLEARFHSEWPGLGANDRYPGKYFDPGK